MMRYSAILGMLLCLTCVLRGATPSLPGAEVRKNSMDDQRQAVARLIKRGHQVDWDRDGWYVCLVPYTDDQRVTLVDIADLNRLDDMVALRVVNLWGIAPAVFDQLKIFPRVRLFAAHYGMPPVTLKYLNRFPNVEKLYFWGGGPLPCENLPELPKLRVFHHECQEGKAFSNESVKRLVACRNLEDVTILLPVSEDGVRMLKTLPKLRILNVNGN